MLRRWYDIDRDMAVVDEMRRRLEGLFGDFDTRSTTRLSGSWPRANLYDSGAALVAVLEVPGLIEDDLEIEGHQDALTISGVRKTETPEGYKVHRNERRPGRFSRTFGLPCKVDLEKTTASLKNGVLTVTLEKAAEAQPKKITVSAG